jgi:hypothetical protein
VALLIYAAYKTPSPLIPAREGRPTWGPARFWVLATVFMFFSFVGYAGGGNFTPYPIVVIGVNSFVGLVILYLLLKHIGTQDNERHLVAFVAGLLTFMIFLSFIHEFFTPGAIGMSIAGIGAITGLAYIYRKVSKRTEAIETEGIEVGPKDSPACNAPCPPRP